MGNCHVILKDTQQARRALARAAVETPEDLDVLIPLAMAQEQLGSPDDAMRTYLSAQRLDPNNRQAEMGLMRVRGMTGAQALRVERESTEPPSPDDDSVMLETKADAAFRSGRYLAASRLLERALLALGEEKPGPRLLRNLAVAFDRSGQRAKALEAYDAAIQRNDADSDLYHRFGKLLAQHGHQEKAVSHLARAAELAPSLWQASDDLGHLLMKRGDTVGAEKAFTQVIRVNPSYASGLQNLAKVQVDNERPAAAVNTLKRWADLSRQDPAPVLAMAALLDRMKREPEKAKALAEACRRGAKTACAP